MPLLLEDKTAINISAIYAMRYSGATLRQIADKIGRTKERIRQILIKNYGSTRHKLFSTRQLCKLSGFSWNQVMKLYQESAITPVRDWHTSSGHYCLWSPATVEQIKVYSKLSKTNRYCRICHCPVPMGRHCYCSEQCYKESHKYKYRSLEARRRHLLSMRKYKEARRQSVREAKNTNRPTTATPAA